MTAWDTQKLPLERLHSLKTGYEDNALSTQYDSGRRIAWQRNTKVKRRYAVTYWATNEQARFFDFWYRVTLGGNGMSFTAPSLEGTGETVVYRLANPPAIEGQQYKDITMEWVEV